MAEYLKQGRRKMGQIRTIRRGGEPKAGRPLGSGRGRMMEITPPPPSTIQPFIYTNLERGSGGWQVNSAIARSETARVRNKKAHAHLCSVPGIGTGTHSITICDLSSIFILLYQQNYKNTRARKRNICLNRMRMWCGVEHAAH